MHIRFLCAWLILWMAGCDSPAPSTGDREQHAAADRPSDGEVTSPAPFDRETAETLAAMHFSDLNRQAKYQRYKGLLIDMDTLFPASPDGSNRFRVRVQGRLWETPAGDTITRPYLDTLILTATWEGNRWTARVTDQ